jgi:hypothetical protein
MLLNESPHFEVFHLKDEVKHILNHEVEIMNEVEMWLVVVRHDIQRVMVAVVMMMNVLQHQVIVTK